MVVESEAAVVFHENAGHGEDGRERDANLQLLALAADRAAALRRAGGGVVNARDAGPPLERDDPAHAALDEGFEGEQQPSRSDFGRLEAQAERPGFERPRCGSDGSKAPRRSAKNCSVARA